MAFLDIIKRIKANVHDFIETRRALGDCATVLGDHEERIESIESAGSSVAPANATYITQTPSGPLLAEQAISATIAAGAILRHHAGGTGVIIAAVAGTDYSAPGHTHTASEVTDFDTEVIALLTDANIPNNLTLDNITQITNRSHTDLTDIGTNTHAGIDSHIAAANPHSGSQPLDATLTALAALDATAGLVTQTAADTFVRRTIQSTTSIVVNNGAGTAGDPSMERAALTGDVTASQNDNATTLATKHKTRTAVFYMEDPAASDEFPIHYFPDAVTIVAVRAITDTGTVDFNVEERAKLTPDVAGTDLNTGDMQAAAAGLEDTSFSNASFAADTWATLTISAVASSPTKLWVTIEWTVD